MCAIFGLLAAHGVHPYLAAIEQAVARGVHRGPDGGGVVLLAQAGARATYVGADQALRPDADGAGVVHAALAHRRLAIIDATDAGRQPMATADGRYWITYNGEVYNHVELRAELEALGHRFGSRSDTEVVLAAYVQWGDDCLQRLNGMWALAIFDTRERELFCARDRFGIKPLFHVAAEGYFAFASEIKQLLSLPGRARRANRQAIYEYLTYGSFHHAEQTFFDGVFQLMPGCAFRYCLGSGAYRSWRWYEFRPSLDRDIGAREAVGRFRELFIDSVRLQLRSDVEVGSCLSGGLDSASIVCVMGDLLGKQGATHRQRTFTAAFREPEADERRFALAVCEARGIGARFVEPDGEGLVESLGPLIWHQEEPFGSTSLYAQWCVFAAARADGVKVLLDGQGADEQLAGYHGFIDTWCGALRRRGDYLGYGLNRVLFDLRLGKRGLLRDLARFVGAGTVAGGGSRWLRSDFAARHAQHSLYDAGAPVAAIGDADPLADVLCRMTLHNNVPALLKYEDRNAMAHSVESRVPFLDHRLVEFTLGLPTRYKLRRGWTKWLLREAMKGVVPETVRRRRDKLGFATPESRWQQGVLRPRIVAALGAGWLDEFVDTDVARGVLDDGGRGETDFAPWRWLNLDLWRQAFDVA
ncbi:MAG: asparagine synthase (glutamine-hydrolyzing) [Gammaproteobacteria bacterium]